MQSAQNNSPVTTRTVTIIFQDRISLVGVIFSLIGAFFVFKKALRRAKITELEPIR